MPRSAQRAAQQVEALPPAPPPEDAAEHDPRARQQVVDQGRVVGRGARIDAAHLGEIIRQPFERPRGGEDLGVCRGYDAKHACFPDFIYDYLLGIERPGIEGSRRWSS